MATGNKNGQKKRETAVTDAGEFLALASADGAERDEAFRQLRRDHVTDGSWSLVGAETIRGLLPRIGTLHAHRVLWLIGEIASGGQRHRLSERAVKASPERTAVIEAVGEGATAILRALGSEDAQTRSGAAYCIGMALEAFEGASALLSEVARDDAEQAVRATATVSLGLLARSGDTLANKAIGSLPGGVGLLRGARWIANELAGEPTLPTQAASAALAWVEAEVDAELLPWGQGNSGMGYATLANRSRMLDTFVHDGPRRRALGVALAAALGSLEHRALGGDKFRGLLVAILHLSGLANHFPTPEVPHASEVSSDERAVLLSLSECPALTSIAAFGSARIGGLPGDGRCIRRWLGEAEATALEWAGNGGEPRWAAARGLVANGADPGDVREAITRDLNALETLRAMTEVMLGAYFLNFDSQMGPVVAEVEEMLELTKAAPSDAVAWASSLVEAVRSHPEAGSAAQWSAGDINASHLLVAFSVLVRAKVPLDTQCDRLIGFAPLDLAREVLTSIPVARRRALAVARVALGFPEMQWAEMEPLLDLIGCRALADAFKEAFSKSEFDKAPEDFEAKLLPYLDTQ